MTTYIAGDNCITSLGFSSGENMRQLLAGKSGIAKQETTGRVGLECYLSLIDLERCDELFSDVADASKYTQLEKLAITSVRYAAEATDIDMESPNTLFIFSTTKGNIELLGEGKNRFSADRLYLWHTAHVISAFFSNPNPPLVVSNACISGVLALITGQRMLDAGGYKNIVVVGGDMATEFVVSGFQSFKALSSKPCKPYDKKRDGLTLGEGVGTMVLTADSNLAGEEKIVLRAGASANDATHISAPSRTGEGLWLAIEKTLELSGHPRESIDFISAHGTATRYNDDMESNALQRAGLDTVPVNSLKGYFGHTLGAAGLIETIVSLHSMRKNMIVGTKGLQSKGVDKDINVIKQTVPAPINHCLKLASGFGGCNAGLLLSKDGTF